MDFGLEGKVAVVGGASKGLGRACALGLAREGARVVVCSRSVENLTLAAREIADETGAEVVPVPSDLSTLDGVQSLINQTVEQMGGLDIIVNNSGGPPAGTAEGADEEAWAQAIQMSLLFFARMSREAVPLMRERGGGRIINVTNLGGRTPGPASMPTSISRAAGIAITKGLSKDLAKENILVTTVCIGLVKSGQHQRRYDARLEKEPSLSLETFYDELAQARSVPIGRVAEPEEAGDVIAFLASERASYLTGIAVNLDGGASAVL